jgi:hypothetical protein
VLYTGVSVTRLLYSAVDKREMQYQSIRITSLLIKMDDQWLSSQHQLVNAYKQIWCDDQYQVHSTVTLLSKLEMLTVNQHYLLLLIKLDDQWPLLQHQLVNAYRQIW